MMRPPITSRPVRQQGVALLLMMFIIGLAVTAYVVKSYDAAAMKARQEEKTMKALAEAKAALIAWSVTHSEVPGMMPYPDRSTDGNYDGPSDCPPGANAFSYTHLIGQLPLYGQTNPCATPQLGVGGDWKDADGNKLWYMVSRNLVREYSIPGRIPGRIPVINPGMLITTNSNYPYDGSVSSSPYPWMKIFDRQGNLISDRIAVVIIAPGIALQGQERGNGLAPANAFLEQITVGGQTIANYDYTKPDEDFVMGGNGDNEINDRLIFITIDELIIALEKRVIKEVKKAINYPLLFGNSQIPWMVKLRDNLTWDWPQNFSLMNEKSGKGTIPFRYLRCSENDWKNKLCDDTYLTGISWELLGESTLVYNNDNTVSAEVVKSFKQYSSDSNPATTKCRFEVVGSKALECTTEFTSSLPSGIARREVHFSFAHNAANILTVPNVITNAHITKYIEAASVVLEVEDFDAANNSKGKGYLRPPNLLKISNVLVYPVMPQWYFTNRWYEYLYAAIAPAFLPGGSGVCTPGTCLHLHYVHNGVTGQRDNLPALIFTRHPPSTYQLNPEEAGEDALDFLQPLTNNTGLVAW